MKEWIISIAVIIILITVISILLPEGKCGKFIKAILSLIVILVIIKPIFNIDINQEVLDVFSYDSSMVLQDDYLNYVSSKKITFYEEEVTNILRSYKIENAKINIDTNVENNQLKVMKIHINLKESVINSSIEHMYIIKDIKSRVAKLLNVKENDVVVYE